MACCRDCSPSAKCTVYNERPHPRRETLKTGAVRAGSRHLCRHQVSYLGVSFKARNASSDFCRQLCSVVIASSALIEGMCYLGLDDAQHLRGVLSAGIAHDVELLAVAKEPQETEHDQIKELHHHQDHPRSFLLVSLLASCQSALVSL